MTAAARALFAFTCAELVKLWQSDAARLWTAWGQLWAGVLTPGQEPDLAPTVQRLWALAHGRTDPQAQSVIVQLLRVHKPDLALAPPPVVLDAVDALRREPFILSPAGPQLFALQSALGWLDLGRGEEITVAQLAAMTGCRYYTVIKASKKPTRDRLVLTGGRAQGLNTVATVAPDMARRYLAQRPRQQPADLGAAP